MADLRVSELTAASSGLGTQEVPVNEGGTNKKVTVSQISDYVKTQVVGKKSWWISADKLIAATTNGPSSAQLETATNKLNYAVKDFDGATQEFCHFNWKPPKSWDLGNIYFKVVWETTNTGTAGVAFSLQGVALSDADTIDAAFGTVQTVTDAGQSSAAKRYTTAESSAMTIAGTPALGDSVQFRLSRDPANGSDTMTEDARVVGVEVIYTVNAVNDN